MVVYLWSWAFLSHSFYVHRGSSDVALYQGYARQVDDGKLPYRDFALEYPPGALAVFLAPTLVASPSQPHAYARWFGRAMGLLGLCSLLLVAGVRRSAAASAYLALSPLLIGSLASTRFDLWPAALTLAALAALLGDRHRLGWAALAAAIAAKLYPAVLIPLAVVWTLRRRGRRELARAAGVGALVLAAAFLPFAILAPHGLWESNWGQLSRQLEIESLAASYLKTFAHPQVIGVHGALALSGHGLIAALSVSAGFAVLLALWLGFAFQEATAERLVCSSAACVCAFIAFGKVLSPQYLIWLVPLVPLVRGRRGLAASALLTAALACTDFVWYGTHRFDDYAFGSHWAWLVLTRNLILVALVAVLGLARSAVLRFCDPSPEIADIQAGRFRERRSLREPTPGPGIRGARGRAPACSKSQAACCRRASRRSGRNRGRCCLGLDCLAAVALDELLRLLVGLVVDDLLGW